MASLSKQYQKKTDKQHILDNPDTYIGSVEQVESNEFVLKWKNNQKNISYLPGLYKLFDEGIVNCRDHVVRMKNNKSESSFPVTYISISINNGTITMTNDGNGIDVAMHLNITFGFLN